MPGLTPVVGSHVNPFHLRLDRDTHGAGTGFAGGDELLPGLDLGISGDAAVDSAGQVYWQFSPWACGPTLDYLAKLRPF